MCIQYINLLDKSFRVKNVFLDEQEQFGVFAIFKRSFPNNIFSVFISKPKFLIPQNSCTLCSVCTTFAHCARQIHDGDENDRICPRSWSVLNHRDGPRTVDIFLERIADIAFSVWTIGYIYCTYYKYRCTSHL
jgi:hypothetical protein